MHLETPLIDWCSPQARDNRRVRLKMECWQPVGSFKIRGIGHLARKAVDQGATRLVTSSGGNAGLALAWAGRVLGTPVHVVVPSSTGTEVRDHLHRLGSRVQVHGEVWDQADDLARGLCRDKGSFYVPPFDHPDIWAGHTTLIEECARQGERPGAVVVAVGGGGLMCGVIAGLHRVGWSDVPVVAVETEGAASLKAAIEAGGPVEIDGIRSLAKTLGALRVAQQAWQWTQDHDVHHIAVSDSQAVAACMAFAEDHRVLVEPACGAALAVLYDDLIPQHEDVLAVVCGGAGVSPGLLNEWSQALNVS